MSSFKNQKISTFLKVLESSDPTPGGGTSAAITGAMSCALVSMVMNLTIGKKNYLASEKRAKQILKISSDNMKKFLDLADKDSKSYQDVIKAYKISKDDENREKKIQQAIKYAVEIPLQTATLAAEIIELSNEALKIGNKNAASDARSAEYLAIAAKKSALENVKINLPYITDENWKRKLKIPQNEF